MIGVIDGIRSGMSDARAEREMQLRAAAEQRARELHDLNMQRMNMELSGLRRRDDALNEVVALQGQGLQRSKADKLAGDDFDAAFAASEKGLPMPAMTPEIQQAYNAPAAPSERQMLAAMQKFALASGDMQGFQGLQRQTKLLDVSDRARELAKSPEFQQRALGMLDKSSLVQARFTQPVYDAKGKMTMPAQLVFDAGGKVDLSEADLTRLAYGAALVDMGFAKEGVEAISSVNKDLGVMVDRANNRIIQTQNSNQGAIDKMRDNDRADEQMRINESLRRAQIGAMNAGRQREIPKELLGRMSAVEQAWINETDPAKKAVLERQYQLLESQAAIALGRPRGLPSRGPTSGLSPKDEVEAAMKLVEASGGKLTMEGAIREIRAGYGGGNLDDEIARQLAALQAGQKREKPGALPNRPTPAPADPITTMDDRTLRRLATMNGHVSQKAAQAELERRASSVPDIDMTGFGYR